MARRDDRLEREVAEKLAISMLAMIAEEPETLGRFLVATGLGPANLREAAHEPRFLAAVVEYVLADESLLLTVAERCRVRPTMIAAARLRLDEAADGE
ncbi:MAG: DUF3572 family protein [Ancalomicrobiaceae bacterium]|nr:DUF3572 family protein [Ancalomicrobiaceae bacterium]